MMIAPRFSGQISPCGQGSTLAKNTSMPTPMQISGTTIGRARAPSTTVLPGNRNRHSASATSAPSTTLSRVETAAMVRLLAKASIRPSLLNAFS